MLEHNEQQKNIVESEEGLEQSAVAQLDSILPVGDHEEEVSENGKKVVKKGVYLVPNLFTTAALFSGFYSVISSMQGNLEYAAIAICVAIVMDIFDGRMARMLNAQSAFGGEYDSLSDMISFGVAPAVLAFQWALNDFGKIGWAIAFIYVACAAVRLARFNTQAAEDKRYFTGLASPAAAALIAFSVWICANKGWLVDGLPSGMGVAALLITLVGGLLMISNIRLRSFKDVGFKARVPLIVLILIIVVFAIVLIDPPTVLLAMLVVYIVTGVLGHLKEKKNLVEK